MNLTDKINQLNQIKSELYKKDFLLTWEKSDDDLKMILDDLGINSRMI